MYISLNVAERIKLRAKEKGISIKKLLEGVSLGFNTMSNMKNSMPKADNLAKIADYLDCSVDYLLSRTDNPEINYLKKERIEMKNNRLLLSGEIKIARENIRELYEENDISIECIEKKLNTNYQTFRSWIDGYGDYFNTIDEIKKIAELFKVDVDRILKKRDGSYVILGENLIASDIEKSIDTVEEDSETIL